MECQEKKGKQRSNRMPEHFPPEAINQKVSEAFGRYQSQDLPVLSMLDLAKLPEKSGVYFAASQSGTILYIGKASNLRLRCDLCVHHKLTKTVKKGAKVLHYYLAPVEMCLAIEQALIGMLNPLLNERFNNRWVGSDFGEETSPEAVAEESEDLSLDIERNQFKQSSTDITGRRFTVTVTGLADNVIKNMAIEEGVKPTTAASYLLEALIRDRLRSGDYPAEWKKTPLENQTNRSAMSLMRSLVYGSPLAMSDVAIISKASGISPCELLERFQNLEGFQGVDPDA